MVLLQEQFFFCYFSDLLKQSEVTSCKCGTCSAKQHLGGQECCRFARNAQEWLAIRRQRFTVKMCQTDSYHFRAHNTEQPRKWQLGAWWYTSALQYDPILKAEESWMSQGAKKPTLLGCQQGQYRKAVSLPQS